MLKQLTLSFGFGSCNNVCQNCLAIRPGPVWCIDACNILSISRCKRDGGRSMCEMACSILCGIGSSNSISIGSSAASYNRQDGCTIEAQQASNIWRWLQGISKLALQPIAVLHGVCGVTDVKGKFKAAMTFLSGWALTWWHACENWVTLGICTWMDFSLHITTEFQDVHHQIRN